VASGEERGLQNLAAGFDSSSRCQMLNREYIRGKKDGPCVDCGQRFEYPFMSFDHCRGEPKKFNLADVQGGRLRRKKVDAELAKCDLVCLECHRKREIRRFRMGIIRWIKFTFFGRSGKPIKMTNST